MHPTPRKDYLIASYLYVVTMVLFLLPALYMLLKPLAEAKHSTDYTLIGIILFTCLLTP